MCGCFEYLLRGRQDKKPHLTKENEAQRREVLNTWLDTLANGGRNPGLLILRTYRMVPPNGKGQQERLERAGNKDVSEGGKHFRKIMKSSKYSLVSSEGKER